MRIFAGLVFLFCTLSAQATLFNVYVKYDDAALKQSLQQFNAYLDAQGILKKYNIRPFVNDFPLHTTLYLANYESYSIPNVMDRIQDKVKHWSQFVVKTDTIVVTPQNYVMLNLVYQIRDSGMNPIIQIYSDEMVLLLMGNRDTSASIPDWAKNDPSKLRAFQRYGSPTVFFEYSPHFTLMAKQFKNKELAEQFQAEMQEAIRQYPWQPLQLTAKEIALGYVDDFGQVTREIASFKLR